MFSLDAFVIVSIFNLWIVESIDAEFVDMVGQL